MPLALAPIVTALVIAAAGVGSVLHGRTVGARPSVASLVWLAVPVVALGAVAAVCAQGLYVGDSDALVPLCVTALAAGASALLRDHVLKALDALAARLGVPRRAPRAMLAMVVLLTCSALGVLAIEVPYNPAALTALPRFALVEGLLVLGGLTLLYFLFQRRGAGVALGVALCLSVGVAQFFMSSFKAAAILPNDLFALGTAAAVSGSYVYQVNEDVLFGLSCLMAAVALSALVAPVRPEGSTGLVRGTVANLACAALAFVALWAGVTVPSYFNDLGVEMKYWYALDYYERQGFLPTFIAVAQDLPIDVPEGYSAAEAADLEASYAETYDQTLGAEGSRAAAEAQFADERPTVICVMNETFADLSVLDGASWGYEGIPFYDSVGDAVMRGPLDVSVLGGGTCNSEFEFLTGVPLDYVGDGKYPYSLYDLSGAPSLAKQFSELGYSTTAIHPNFASNWNRDRAYEALGFDRFLSFDAFENADYFHSGVSDAETYDKVLELLEEDDSPQFIFDVTMQNHSGYDQGNIGDVRQYAVDGVSDYDNGRLSEYLGCISESDRALAEFMAELKELDRPVVLVFFGDHQPALSSIVNDALYPNEDEFEHNLRTYETTYLVWANYDLAGSTQDSQVVETSPAYLAALTANAIGMPLTDYQKALLVARLDMPSISLMGIRDASGAWLDPASGDELPAAYDDLSRISYLEFADKLS